MGQQQSKGESVYQQVLSLNVEEIKALRREGAGLEWRDGNGKTPLMLACMKRARYNVAKTLIELGANVNAYCPGRQAGTPLHHAARGDLENTVKLLLSHRANPRRLNHYGQTALQVARTKGFSNVVRAIENHIFLQNSQPPSVQATEPPSDSDVEDFVENLEYAMALSASIQSAISETTPFDVHSSSRAGTSTSGYNGAGVSVASVPVEASSSDWTAPEAGSSGSSTQATAVHSNDTPVVPATNQTSVLTPSAPPIADEIIEDGPIHYPSIDTSSIDLTSPTDSTGPRKEEGSTRSCVVCLDAPSEAACVPCGHVAGCLSCLNEIKAKKWGCPACRAKIEQVIKIYHV